MAPKGVILSVSELPKSWGYAQASKQGIKIIKPAADLDAKPPSREFVAAIMRRFESENGLTTEYARGYTNGRKDRWNEDAKDIEWHKKELDEKRQMQNDFEKNSGIGYVWPENAPRIGKAVRLLSESSIFDILGHLKERAQILAKNIEEAEKEIMEWQKYMKEKEGEKSA